MKKALLTVAFVLIGPLAASAGLNDQQQQQQQGQQQGQGQLQGQAQANIQGQGQVGIVEDGATSVNVPRDHYVAPALTVNTQAGQTGGGISFPGGSLGNSKTEPIPAAQQFIELCGQDVGCTEEDIANAVDYARSQIKSCYLLGPVGHLLTFIGDKVKLESLDLEGDGNLLCF